MRSLYRSIAVLPLLFSSTLISQTLTASEARTHVGENATVCGQIAGERTAESSPGKPMFLNLDQAYPKQIFTIVVWGSDREAIGKLPDAGRVCVAGRIELYRGVPEIVVRSPAKLYVPTLSNDRHYTNSDGNSVHSPASSNGGVPVGAKALCRDGTYSFSEHRQGTCSHHGGVEKWL